MQYVKSKPNRIESATEISVSESVTEWCTGRVSWRSGRVGSGLQGSDRVAGSMSLGRGGLSGSGREICLSRRRGFVRWLGRIRGRARGWCHVSQYGSQCGCRVLAPEWLNNQVINISNSQFKNQNSININIAAVDACLAKKLQAEASAAEIDNVCNLRVRPRSRSGAVAENGGHAVAE